MKDLKRVAQNPTLDFIATYVNGDGYVQRRSDKRGYLCYVKESDPQKLEVFNRAVHEVLALKNYNIKLSSRITRAGVPLSFHSAAALAVYGCTKVLKIIPWYTSGRYFAFLLKVKDSAHITVRDKIVKDSIRLRELARNGYLQKIYESKGNRTPSVYRLSSKALMLYQALKLAIKPQTRRRLVIKFPTVSHLLASFTF